MNLRGNPPKFLYFWYPLPLMFYCTCKKEVSNFFEICSFDTSIFFEKLSKISQKFVKFFQNDIENFEIFSINWFIIGISHTRFSEVSLFKLLIEIVHVECCKIFEMAMSRINRGKGPSSKKWKWEIESSLGETPGVSFSILVGCWKVNQKV